MNQYARLSFRRMVAAGCLILAYALVVLPQSSNQSAPAGSINGQFEVKLEAGAIISLRRLQDRINTEYVQSGRRLGDVSLRYRGKDGAWQSVDTAQLARDGKVTFAPSADGRVYKANYQVLYAPASSNTGRASTQARQFQC